MKTGRIRSGLFSSFFFACNRFALKTKIIITTEHYSRIKLVSRICSFSAVLNGFPLCACAGRRTVTRSAQVMLQRRDNLSEKRVIPSARGAFIFIPKI